ncbi:protein-tyrosine-phosphatase [Balneola sp. MJW-20]|uniref:protein-tyrosine-phosphatase n=1 Tax=Gracilimonas aurantiaca TaxID=3234185 RepID=UPI003464F75E
MNQVAVVADMYTEIENYLIARETEFALIDNKRKSSLKNLSEHIKIDRISGRIPKLNFICTHNSRRSHLASVWAAAANNYLGSEPLETYSGGTEVTAFSHRAVEALSRAGFQISKKGEHNPKYELRYGDDTAPLICYSKTFNDPANPQSGFAAVMTCSEADERCPAVSGADFRIALPYRDPKESDGTAAESKIYDDRCKQIAREMLFVMKHARKEKE